MMSWRKWLPLLCGASIGLMAALYGIFNMLFPFLIGFIWGAVAGADKNCPFREEG